MIPVTTHGAPKITINNKDRYYDSERAVAEAMGANPNHYMTGIQVGEADVDLDKAAQELGNNLQGRITYEERIGPPENASGSTYYEVAVPVVQEDLANSQLEDRLKMYMQATGNGSTSLNNRAETGSII